MENSQGVGSRLQKKSPGSGMRVLARLAAHGPIWFHRDKACWVGGAAGRDYKQICALPVR